MSTLKTLKNYLLGKDGDIGYLFNDDNNGKTVMLSGAWGSGKTHFWLEDVKPQLTKKNQKNIYISLYGRESISELKFEVLKEAYNLEVKDDIISKSASMLSTIAPSFGKKSLVDGFDKLNKKAKEKKAEEILKSGSIICLDDFERKSSKIDLNDLFGYISQLALDYKCKVVIILNSDVFEGEEANVFKTVKEKTVNKFFYFEPSRKELFDSIYDRKDEKYKNLNNYREEIFNAIEKTEELNARIYIQVLDNCLEWIDKRYDSKVIRELVLSTMFFTKYYMTLNYQKIENNKKIYDASKFFSDDGFVEIGQILNNHSNLFGDNPNYFSIKESIQVIYQVLNKHKKEDKESITEDFSQRQNAMIERHKELIQTFVQYIYAFQVDKNIEKNMYDEIQTFVKSGILLKKEDN